MDEQSLENAYIATVKVGPKGQIVIPKEIRRRLDLQPGENLLLTAGSGPGFMVCPLSGCREILSQLLERLPQEADSDDALPPPGMDGKA